MAFIGGSWAFARTKQEGLVMQLGQAVIRQDVVKVRSLLRRGADPNQMLVVDALDRKPLVLEGSMGTPWNSLHLAAMVGNTDILRLILKAGGKVDEPTGADPISVPSGHWTPLHIAVRSGRVQATQVLINEGKASLEAKDAEGLTPLAMAMEAYPPPDEPGDLAVARRGIARFLLDSGADVHVRWRRGSTSTLICAVTAGDTGMIAALMRKGTSFLEAFKLSLSIPNLTSLKAMLEVNPGLANVKVDDHFPLEIAAWNGNAEAVACLVQGGAKLLSKQLYPGGMTPVHHAAAAGSLASLRQFGSLNPSVVRLK